MASTHLQPCFGDPLVADIFASYIPPEEAFYLLRLPHDKVKSAWNAFAGVLKRHILKTYVAFAFVCKPPHYAPSQPDKRLKGALIAQRWFRRNYDRQSLFIRYHAMNKKNHEKSRPLHLKEVIHPLQIQKFALQLESWNRQILKKHPEITKDFYLYAETKINSCYGLIQIARELCQKRNFLSLFRIRCLLDDQGRMQAFSLLSTDDESSALEIEYLASAPHNVDKTIAPSKIVKNAPSALIAEAAFTSMRKNTQKSQSGIILSSIRSAVLYYEHLGFEVQKGEDAPHKILQGARLRAFLRKYGGRVWID